MHDDAKPRLHLLLIPLTALLAVVPLMAHGASCGHDFDFHLLSWFEAAQQLVHGHFPQWAYTPGWNAGEPRFVFYPPLSWLIGATLGLLLPWVSTPIVYTWLALTASGFTMHRLARAYAAPATALSASVLYMVNPYMLFTAYERTAYAELLAAAWMPLLLQAALAEEPGALQIALPVTLLWLTNAPAGVMGCYTLAGIILIRLMQSPATKRVSLAMTSAAGTALGLALAAFYLIPAAYEQRFVQVSLAMVPGMRIVDNTLFHHTDDALHDQVLRTASTIAVEFILMTAVALYFARRNRLAPTLAIVTAVITLLLLPVSLPIWHHAPELAFLQFPWRFLVVLSAVFCLTLALTPFLRKASPLLVAILFIYFGYQTFHQPCDDEDTVTARLALFHSNAGTDPTDEYTPQTGDNDSIQHADPPYWFVPTGQDDLQPAQTHPGQAPHHLVVNPTEPQTLVLNLRDFPSWRVTRNGAPVTSVRHRNDGLIAIPLPAGHSTIDITESRPFDRTLGDGVSIASLLLALALVRRKTTRASQVA